MIWQIIGAFIVSVSVCVYLNAPKETALKSGFIGTLGWTIYLLVEKFYGPSVGTLIAGLVIVTFAHLFARRFKYPVTIFIIPGFFPLVPGYRIYSAVYHFILGNRELGMENLELTLKISGMIALSVFIIDITFMTISKMKRFIKIDQKFGN